MLCNCYILFLLDSMHFTESDYHATGANVKKRYLKPDIIPTKNVHPNILQIFQPYTHTINDCNRDIVVTEGEINELPSTIPTCDRDIVEIEETVNNEPPSTIPTCSKCDELVNENNQLRKKIDEMNKL